MSDLNEPLREIKFIFISSGFALSLAHDQRRHTPFDIGGGFPRSSPAGGAVLPVPEFLMIPDTAESIASNLLSPAACRTS
jgi:hypothetical protein